MIEEQEYQDLVFDRQADFELEKEIEQEEYQSYEDLDAHCCSMNADLYGYCQICGAVIYGSYAYSELYGGE